VNPAYRSDSKPVEAKPRVYDILARSFAQEEVRTCFALLGDANMNWAARLAELGCRMIYTRHEHCALAAAMAYSRKNREVAVATVTCGPGVTQLITALWRQCARICRSWCSPASRR
jgi:thiamine pyrophosphate-dependent acetolactate synthase large subunit-like protein